MRWGIESKPLIVTLPYAGPITDACDYLDFPTSLAYAIAWHESIEGEVAGDWNAALVISDDGGHGVFQLTSSWPMDWTDPLSNAQYAISKFLLPNAQYWNNVYALSGNDLIRCVAASFNAGLGAAVRGHLNGNVDSVTEHGDYASSVLGIYQSLQGTGRPTP